MRNRLAVVGLAVVVAGVIGAGNGRSRALNAHEILVAQTAEEMQERGDYLVPYYNGGIRLEKPPLSYWLAIVAHRLVGSSSTTQMTELEARLPSLVAGLLLLLVTFALGVVAYRDEVVGLTSAGLLATTWHFFTFSRNARPEMLYALCCNVVMLAFLVAIRRAQSQRSTLTAALFGWTALAAALFAKGPQLPLFFLVGIAIALRSWEPRVSFWKALRPGLGLLVLALVVPYFVYLAKQAESAASFWAAQMVQDEPVPLWLRPLRLYYVFALLVGLCPWIAVLALPFLQERTRRHPSTRLFCACIVVTVACLSFAGKLRDHYVLPAIPLACLVIAAALVEVARSYAANESQGVGVRRVAIGQAALTVIAFVGIAGLAVVRSWAGAPRAWLVALPWLALAVALALYALRAAALRPGVGAAAYISALLAAWMAVSFAGLDAPPRWESDAEFAAELDRAMPAGLPVVLESGTHESVVYYGNRRVIRSPAREWLNAHPNEPAPYLVCEGRCVGVDGEIVIAERGRSESEPMILLRPFARSADSGAASAAPAPAPQ